MKFDHLTLLTDEIEILLKFYSSLPGVTVRGPSTMGYAEVSFGETVIGVFHRLGLSSALGVELGNSSAGSAGSAVVQVLVSDVDTEAEAIQTAGLTILAGPTNLPWGSRSVYLADPDGNLVEFYQW